MPIVTRAETTDGPVGKRRKAREMALQMLYQQDLAGAESRDILASFDVETCGVEGDEGTDPAELRQAFAYARELVEGTIEHRQRIDEHITSQAENWRLERMPAVDRNVLRLAVYELEFQPDVPKVVVLNEAIELAKRYGSEQSGRFVNGLLDALIERLGQ